MSSNLELSDAIVSRVGIHVPNDGMKFTEKTKTADIAPKDRLLGEIDVWRRAGRAAPMIGSMSVDERAKGLYFGVPKERLPEFTHNGAGYHRWEMSATESLWENGK